MEKIIKYFCDLHDIGVNQKYAGSLPYSFHLEMVGKQAYKFKHLIPSYDNLWETIIISCYAHDAIEDARKTYNDILELCGEDVADIVYCCTEDKGKNRSERHSDKFYNDLRKNKWAIFVKLCDIIANVKFSLLTNSTMFSKYKKEYSKTKEFLYENDFEEMFDYLEKLFAVEK